MSGEYNAGADAARADLFDAVGHPVRVKILHLVDKRPMSFSELKESVGIDSSGHLSWHLGKLSRLVEADANGTYRLTSEGREALALVDAVGESERLASVAGVRRRRPAWKAVLLAGVLLLVIGVGIALIASVGAGSAAIANNSVPLMSYAQGEYVSTPINLTSSEFLMIASPYAYALVRSAQVPLVTSQNVGQYAVSPAFISSSSTGSIETYLGQSGSYTIVEFSAGVSAPTISYARGFETTLGAYSAGYLGGIIAVVVGLAVSVTGLYLRRRALIHVQMKEVGGRQGATKRVAKLLIDQGKLTIPMGTFESYATRT